MFLLLSTFTVHFNFNPLWKLKYSKNKQLFTLSPNHVAREVGKRWLCSSCSVLVTVGGGSDGWSYKSTCWTHYGTGTTPCTPLTKTYMRLKMRRPHPLTYFSCDQNNSLSGESNPLDLSTSSGIASRVLASLRLCRSAPYMMERTGVVYANMGPDHLRFTTWNS